MATWERVPDHSDFGRLTRIEKMFAVPFQEDRFIADMDSIASVHAKFPLTRVGGVSGYTAYDHLMRATVSALDTGVHAENDTPWPCYIDHDPLNHGD